MHARRKPAMSGPGEVSRCSLRVPGPGCVDRVAWRPGRAVAEPASPSAPTGRDSARSRRDHHRGPRVCRVRRPGRVDRWVYAGHRAIQPGRHPGCRRDEPGRGRARHVRARGRGRRAPAPRGPAGGAGRAHRHVPVLPVSPRGGHRGVRPVQRGPQAATRHGEGGGSSTEPRPDRVMGRRRPARGPRPGGVNRGVRHLPRAGRRRAPRGLGLSEPRRRRTVHPGAHRDMTTVHELEIPRPATPVPADFEVAENGKFPASAYPDAGAYFIGYARELARAATSVEGSLLDRAASILLEAYTRGARVFSCGNGGSAAIANHMQCDQVKGLRTGTDLTPRFVSLSSNIEVLTAIANDLAYEDVFSYQLRTKPGRGKDPHP